MAAYTPMISAKSLGYGNPATEELMQTDPDEPMIALQLFGHEPDAIRAAIERADLTPYAWIDLNMGCPTPKVTKQGDGCALMRDPKTAMELIRTAKEASRKQVSVKFRAGWDLQHLNAVEFAKMAQDAGADMLCVHPRTAVQMYRDKADVSLWSRVTHAVSIPVIASGDMKDLAQAKCAFDSGCAGVMIARGSYGDPWIFERLRTQLAGENYEEPSEAQRMALALAHASMLTEDLPERVAMLQMRKHIAWYIHGYRDAAALRARINEIVTLDELRSVIVRFTNETFGFREDDLLKLADETQKSVIYQGKLDI